MQEEPREVWHRRQAYVMFGPPCDKLGVSPIPERYGIIQTGKDIVYAESCIPVLQPTQLSGPPQLIAESELFRLLWFLRPNPLQNRIDG